MKKIFDYYDAVDYLESQGVSCDPCFGGAYAELACDLLDTDYTNRDGDDLYYSTEALEGIISRVKQAKEDHEYDDDDEEIPECETYFDEACEIIPGEEEELKEASTAEKRAFAGGGADEDDLVQGRAIARIKDPKDREAAIAAKKANRDDVVKQFTGDRKEDQAVGAFNKKAQKMQAAGVRSIDEDWDDDMINAFLAQCADEEDEVPVEEPIEEKITPSDARKQRALEMYGKLKEWAKDAKDRTSCMCNVSVEQLNEWIGEDK